MTARRERIARSFGQARDYEGQARVQRRTAEALAERIAGLRLPQNPRVLEIGCGTGFLTRALLDRGLGGEWWITDLAPAMVGLCRQRIGDAPDAPPRHFAAMDGEYDPPPAGRFDLVCSSLAAQWFDDAPAALTRMTRWLAPGGHCLVATLGARSLGEWRDAHAAAEMGAGPGAVPAAGTPDFTPAERFAALPGWSARTDILRERYPDARSFLHALKAIGAGTARARHQPLTPAQLRRVMAAFDRNGGEVTYEVVTCHFVRAS